MPIELVLSTGTPRTGSGVFAAVIPGFERVADRGVVYDAPDALSAYRGFLAAVRLAGLADD